MIERLTRAVAALEALGAEIRWGRPASDGEVQALNEHVGCAFPADYVAFLKARGALAVTGELPWFYVYGHAPGDEELDLVAATQAVRAELDAWGRDAVVICPVHSIQHFPSECRVLDASGAYMTLWRGRLEPADGSVIESIVAELESHARDLAERNQASVARTSFLDALRSIVPAELVAPSDRDEPGRGLRLRRAADEVEILIHFGDGRELGGVAAGVFASWIETPAPSPAAMNAYNARAAFVRGAIQGDRARHRGLLPAEGLEPARFLHALDHDARLTTGTSVALPPRPAAPALDEVRAAVEGNPLLSPEERLLRAMFGGKPLPTKPKSKLALEVSVGPAGIVQVSHTIETGRAGDDVLFVLAQVNGGDVRGGDVNLDMEPMVRAWADGGRATFAVATTRAAIGTDGHDRAMAELERQIERSGLKVAPDAHAPRYAALAELVGVDTGPASRALLAGLSSRGRASLQLGFAGDMPGLRLPVYATPWGEVASFIRVRDVALLGYEAVEIGLARAVKERDGATTDECLVVGVRGGEARLLARDVSDFITVLVLGTTGFAFEGDDQRAWRDYRELVSTNGDLPEHFFRDGELLLRAIGREAAPSVGAVREAAARAAEGRPVRGEATRVG